jgi:glycerol dehydrogenase
MQKNIELPFKLGLPARYVQGYGVLDQLGNELSAMGEKPFILVDRYIWSLFEKDITHSLEKATSQYEVCEFEGECCHEEINRTAMQSREKGCDVIAGIGGGKALDTAKAVSHRLNKPMVMVPTTASNDAPTSRLVVVYTSEGKLEEVLTLAVNPQLVLVDTKVIAAAPVRFLVAGIGDALTTKFEAEQCALAGYPSSMNGRQTCAALALSNLCYEIIREDGLKAKQAVQQKLVTPAVDRVIEANILLSGLGFENGGLSVAHALTRGLSALPELHGALHGEEVAYGLLVQFVLENRSSSFMLDIRQFYRDIGLPLGLPDLGLEDPQDHHFQTIAHYTCVSPQSHVHKLTVPVNERIITDAMRMVDSMARDGG